MTSAEAVNRLRALLNQYGITTGFHLDAVLYKLLDSAQLEVITTLKGKQDLMQKYDKGWESSALQPLIVPDATTALSSGVQEYALPSDFLYTYSMELDVDNVGEKYKATLQGYNWFLWKEGNSFARATSKNPRYYIRSIVSAPKFGIKPLPSTSSATYLHNYYKVPATVQSGTEFALRPETHNGIIYFALSYALEQEQRVEDSIKQKTVAINYLKDF